MMWPILEKVKVNKDKFKDINYEITINWSSDWEAISWKPMWKITSGTNAWPTEQQYIVKNGTYETLLKKLWMITVIFSTSMFSSSWRRLSSSDCNKKQIKLTKSQKTWKMTLQNNGALKV